MIRAKTLVLVMAAALGAAAFALPMPVMAEAGTTTQPGAQRGAEHHERLRRLREALEKVNLTADQKTQIHAIVKDAREQLRTLFQGAKGGDRSQLREQAKAIVKGAIQKIAGILTPEQKKQLREELREERQH